MSKKLFMKPLKALASPGIYLFGKYNQYKRERQQSYRPNLPTENELSQLNTKIDKLLNKLSGNHVEMAATPDEECVICVNAKAVMQTYPCGHKVVCRRCFVKTIQIALSQRTLPLCCVICRTKILRLKHTTENSRTSFSSSSSYSYSYSYSSSFSSSAQPFSCRQSSRKRSSKRSAEVLRSSCSLESNPWPSRNKYSRSLTGVSGGSLRLKSSANRSHSAVVYRQPTNSMRKCYRSCSLSSYCSSDKGAKSKSTGNKNYRQVNCDQVGHLQFVVKRFYTLLYNSFVKQYTNANLQKDYSQPQTKHNNSASNVEAANSSRDKLIRQFQRDFKEGQLPTRPTSIRMKSPAQKVPSPSPKRYYNPNHDIKCVISKLDSKQTNASTKRKLSDKKKSTENVKHPEKSNWTKDKQSTKSTTKQVKSEVHSKNRLFHRMGKNFKTSKKEKTAD